MLLVAASVCCGVEAEAVRAVETGGYPDWNMPCQRPPYGRTGKCPGYEWGAVKDGPRASAISSRGYFYRNCTDWVAWRLLKLGVPDSKVRGLHNGGEWGAGALARGISVTGTPRPGDAAVRVGSPGHVAFVEAVGNGLITISQYNGDETGTYSKQTGTPAALNFQQFVHFGTKMPASWYLRNYNSSGPSSTSFGYARSTDVPLVGDWDGVGGDTVGVFRAGTWYLRNYNSSGSSFTSFGFGRATDRPLVGDWDGDGRDTIGVFRGGTWYLRNSNSSGPADVVFSYGRSTDKPVVGNWDDVGGDTVGVFRSGTWYLRNYNSSGPSSTSFGYGRSTDVPLVGNWDGVGGDTVGVFRAGTWFERNYNSSGPSAVSFGYGRATDRPLVGDWDGFGGDTVGVFR